MRNLLPCGIVMRWLLVLMLLTIGMPIIAQEGTAPTSPTPAAPNPKDVTLDVQQQALANRFERFQTTLLQMAEQMRKTDPDRAELLFRTLSKSQEERVSAQMKLIEQLLAKKGDKGSEFGSALQNQEQLLKSLRVLLELMQSENRINEIDAERKRIEALLKDTNKLIGKEKDVRAATERGGDPDKLKAQQKKVEDETKQVIDKIDQQDAAKNAQKSPDSKPQSGEAKKNDKGQSGEPKEGDDPKDPEKKSRIQKKDDNKPNDPESKPKPDGQKQDGQKQDGQKSEGQPQPGQSQKGDPQPGQPQQGQPQSGQSQEGQEQKPADQPQTPGREDLEKAREEMRKAQEELQKKDRDNASKHQDEALKRLLEAKEKFEEILRQLREEEKQLTLTALEARFRKMLALQLLVYNDTVTLAKNGKPTDDTFASRSKQLARNEDEIIREVEKALILLREEGSSVAFPEATEAIRDDMRTVSQRLDQSNVGELTQTIEQSIIEALEEMIDALQKEIEKSKDKDKQDQGQQQQSQPGEEPLVDAISELKMLRSLQLRINRTTKKLGKLIEGEQASEPEVVEQLQNLSRRQSKIQQATYDLSIGKNK